MSGSLASSARTVPIRGTGTPVYLLELSEGSDALTLINLSQKAGMVWVSSDSNVQPGTGVPVPGGGSINWTSTGPLYAVVAKGDPDASVVLTAAIDGWQLPPVPEPDTDLWTYTGQLTIPGNQGNPVTLNLTDALPASQSWGTVLVTTRVALANASAANNGSSVSFVLNQPSIGGATPIGSAAISTAAGKDAVFATSATAAIAKAPYTITATFAPFTGSATNSTAQATISVALAPS